MEYLMFMSVASLIGALKIIAGVSVFFVWAVRYENIKKEFNHYNLPKWVRDFVGILKISFTAMLQSSDTELVLLGSLGIILLMTAAVTTHFRVNNPLKSMIPAISMLSIGLIIFFYTINLQ